MRALVLVALCACAGAHPAAMARRPNPTSDPALEVSVRGPSRVRYDPIAVGVGGQQVVVSLRNLSNAVVPIGTLRVAFSARRDGVELPCVEHPPLAAREPRVVAARSTVEIVRELDCAMPLTGLYEVRVFGAWEGAPSHEVGTFTMEVYDPAHRAPRPITGRPGLLAAVAGPPLVMPTASYDATVVVVNGSKVVQPLGALEITLRSKPETKEFWCLGEPVIVAAPNALAPGQSFVTRSRLHCLLTEVGIHEVAALLAVEGSTLASEVGSMQVEVTTDPIKLSPLRLPGPERLGPRPPISR